MRSVIGALIGVGMLMAPMVAYAASDLPPAIVLNLDDPVDPPTLSPWVGAVAGAAVVVVGVNAWTGGALLAPTLGATVSNVLGGSLFGAAAMAPLAAQDLFRSTTTIATAFLGGGLGYWLVTKQ